MHVTPGVEILTSATRERIAALESRLQRAEAVIEAARTFADHPFAQEFAFLREALRVYDQEPK